MSQKLLRMVLLLIITQLLVVSSSVAESLSQQRLAYQQARHAQQAGDWPKARQIMATLRDYPLYSYLRYYDLAEHLDLGHFQQVVTFRAQHYGLPTANALERSYLDYLVSQQQWSLLLKFYPKEPNSESLRCSYYYAQYQVGSKQLAWQGARKLWLTGNSRPKSCDLLFERFRRAGKLTQILIWQRYLLAYGDYQGRLQHYLSSQLKGHYLTAAKQLEQDDAKPERLLHRTVKLTELHRQGLRLVLMRLTWHQPELAITIYRRFAKALRRHNEPDRALIVQLIRSAIRYPEAGQLAWADQQLLQLVDVITVQRRIRLALAQQDWPSVSRFIAILPKRVRDQTKWQYWSARVIEQKGDLQRARQIWQRIATERSYYGFLSAERLGNNYQLNRTILPANLPPKALANIGWLQVQELMAQQQYRDAYRRWRTFLYSRQPQQRVRWGIEALQRDWPELAVASTIQAKAWDMLELRFPFAYQDIFTHQAKRYGIDPLLSMALARQESAFYRYASSRVGARGLMQLTPATTRDLMAKRGKQVHSYDSLYQPQTNISLGSQYLADLLDRYQGNRYLAMAAYNAGPRRVSQWFKRFGSLPADIWIEAIPFNETRRYVKNILSYELIYAHNSGLSRALIKPTEWQVSVDQLNAKDSAE
ncbi:transglycosylase SLT domain-containing protein [Celerinatantimonas yamalensis]|uniref:Transglycosylase SLT domain-containing protein n=1 Tax=Celerinatantimonas yamalensis TaxID=559956 RepID=A0ABW9G7Z4_9GAMM